MLLDVAEKRHLHRRQERISVARVVLAGHHEKDGAIGLRVGGAQGEAHHAHQHIADPVAAVARFIQRHGPAIAGHGLEAHRERGDVLRLHLAFDLFLQNLQRDGIDKDRDAHNQGDGEGRARDEEQCQASAAGQPLERQGQKDE